MNNNEDTRKLLNSPINIGNKILKNRMILAPMAGINHLGFRKIISSFGGYGLLFTGMLNSKAVPTEKMENSKVLKFHKDELSSLGAQIFGNDPEFMAKASKRLESEGFFCIDLNFGCCVSAICNKEYGAALLKKPELAEKIIENVKKAVSFPVFVKMRTGWTDDIENAVNLAKRFENSGADAITFHPRTAPDKRSRPPKHKYTKIIKENVKIPVFANGNIFSLDDASEVLSLTHCDGVSLGRIAIAKPWIFASWTQNKKFDYDIYEKTLRKVLDEYSFYFGDKYGKKLFIKFYSYFCANFKFGNEFSGIFEKKDKTIEEMKNEITMLFKKHPEISEKPNLNIFSK
ncbi:MAG: tRNA-dihydrouridine synthase family protein [Desulforegulaceae bacterium]|nr:tRNA-dihydrouridine synthase family protein [Desulforegulaceae bacterium]